MRGSKSKLRINEYSGEESKLLSELRDGDLFAFKLLYSRYNIRLINYCYWFLRSKEDAEEAVQDVFVKLWKYKERTKSNESFSYYLFKIAKNTCLNKIRERHGDLYSLELDASFSDQASLEDDIVFRELTLISNKAVEQLPKKRRIIYRLSREKGLTHSEIAKRLRISVSTVENQMGKALKHLRRYLKTHADIAIALTMGIHSF